MYLFDLDKYGSIQIGCYERRSIQLQFVIYADFPVFVHCKCVCIALQLWSKHIPDSGHEAQLWMTILVRWLIHWMSFQSKLTNFAVSARFWVMLIISNCKHCNHNVRVNLAQRNRNIYRTGFIMNAPIYVFMNMKIVYKFHFK